MPLLSSQFRRYGIFLPIKYLIVKRSTAVLLALVALFLPLLSGWLINKFWGISGMRTMAVGESVTTFDNRGEKGRIPLGFTLLLQRQINDYGPVSIKIRVVDREAVEDIGFCELKEGQPEVRLPGRNLYLRLDRYDDESKSLFLQARTTGPSTELSLSLADYANMYNEFLNYRIFLHSYQFPPEKPRISAKLAIIESGDVLFERWLEDGSEITWRGMRLFLDGWGIKPDGTSYIIVRAEKKPGTPLFWLSLLLLPGGILRKWFRARQKAKGFEAPSDSAVVSGRQRRFIAIGVILALILVEGGCRLIELARDLIVGENNPYVELRKPAPVFQAIEENGQIIYRRTSYHRLILGGQSFAQAKPQNVYRIFLLGGSAAGGWPYSKGKYNIASFLQQKLSRLFPWLQFEVINVAGGTYGSHRVKAILDEIIGYQPDLVLIYNGNNEFLESFVFLPPKPPGLLQHLATARLGYDIYRRLGQIKPSYEVDSYTIADQVSNRIAFAFGKTSPYRRDPAQFAELLDHYRFNMEQMVKKCKEKGVPVLLLNVPVNLKDWIPNASRHRAGLASGDIAEWQRDFREGFLRLKNGEYAAAVHFLQRAVAIDDEYAESWYHLGKALLKMGKTEQAKAAFVTALEKDYYPFRELPVMQSILRDIASRHGIRLVDIAGALERNTTDGIIGLDVLLDYVHPTLHSQETIALEVLIAMEDSGMLPGLPSLPAKELGLNTRYDFQPMVEASAIESLYRQYVIMRQYDKLEWIYQRYLATMDKAMAVDPKLSPFCQEGLKIIKKIHPVFINYYQLLLAEKLGLLEKKFTRQEAQAVFFEYTEVIRRMEAPHMSRETFLSQVPGQ